MTDIIGVLNTHDEEDAAYLQVHIINMDIYYIFIFVSSKYLHASLIFKFVDTLRVFLFLFIFLTSITLYFPNSLKITGTRRESPA